MYIRPVSYTKRKTARNQFGIHVFCSRSAQRAPISIASKATTARRRCWSSLMTHSRDGLTVANSVDDEHAYTDGTVSVIVTTSSQSRSLVR